MKAILEFNLPEDKQEFNLATKASDWWYVCWQMDQYLRKRLKYDNGITEDKQEFNLATKASDWWYVCWQMDQYLRKRLKYDNGITEEQREVYEDTRGELWRMMNESGVSLDDAG